MFNRMDREEYERWHRAGKERGWFDRTRDEIASWFGNDEADSRRRMDEYRRQPAPWSQRYGAGEEGDYGYGSSYQMEGGRGSCSYGSPYASSAYGADHWAGRDSEFYTRYGSRLNPSPAYGWSQGMMRGGRGPKSYRRSDECVMDDIHERLDHHPDIDVRDIDVEVKNGEVTLKGTVPTRRDKRLCEVIVDNVYGVKNVHNMIHVEMGNFEREAEPVGAGQRTLAKR